jgi:hypothetical protein
MFILMTTLAEHMNYKETKTLRLVSAQIMLRSTIHGNMMLKVLVMATAQSVM